MRLKIQYLETFPMPVLDEATQRALETITRSGASSATQSEIDELATSAFLVSDSELASIQHWITNRKGLITGELAPQELIENEEPST